MRITRKYWSSDAISKHFVQNDTNHYVIVNRKQTFKYKYKEIGTDKHLKATNLSLITNYQGIFFFAFSSCAIQKPHYICIPTVQYLRSYLNI